MRVDLIKSKYNLALNQAFLGRFEEASNFCDEALDIIQYSSPKSHLKMVIKVTKLVAWMLRQQGKDDLALKLETEVDMAERRCS